MVNECSWYCEDCNESFCEHCEKAVEVKGSFYCDECATKIEDANSGGNE